MARLEKRQQKAQRKQERKLGLRPDSDAEDENLPAGLDDENSAAAPESETAGEETSNPR